jgi:hypothetical protein
MVDKLVLKGLPEQELEKLARVSGGLKLALEELGRRRHLLLRGETNDYDPGAHARSLESTMSFLGRRAATKTRIKKTGGL